jgi:adenylate kinase
VNIVLLGAQGSGKGTQSELLAKRFNLVVLEMGRVLRSVADSNNKYAGVVKETINKGEHVPDEYVRLIAWDFIKKNIKTTTGFVFDGYPRSSAQYEALGDMLRRFGKRIDWVITLKISEDESIRRLAGRRMCAACGEIFNLITDDKPLSDNTCKKCGGELIQRDDDQPDAVRKRLRLFHERTEPILNVARKEGVLLEIDGQRPINEIFYDISEKIT